MQLNLRTKILAIFISVITLLGCTIIFFADTQINKLVTKKTQDELNAASNLGISLFNDKYSGEWRAKEGKLYKGEKQVDGETQIIDEIKRQANVVVTIFYGDTRIATNVMKDGNRIIGTKVSPKVADVVLKQNIEYTGKADVNGVSHFTKYTPILDKDWNVVGIWFVGIESSTIDTQVAEMRLAIIVIVLFIMAITLLVIFLFSSYLTKNIKAVQKALKEVAQGNLNVQAVVKGKDEIGDIAAHVNHMIDSIRHLITDARHMSAAVAATAEEMLVSSENIGRHSEQVAVSVSELAKGASEQALSTEKGDAQINELVEELGKIAQEMNHSSVMAESARQTVETGEKSVRHQEIRMAENKNATGMASGVVAGLSGKSQEIGQIVELIRGVADQTNLLALNAAIEAARAGEQGKGFAVVAEEIRKLAEQTRTSAEQITQLIKDVQLDVEHAVAETKKAETAVSEQEKVVGETVKAFHDIAQTVNTIMVGIKAVTLSTETLNSKAAQTAEAIHDIASIAEETAAGTQEVAASTQEQAATIQQVIHSVKNLSGMAHKLQESIRMFEV